MTAAESPDAAKVDQARARRREIGRQLVEAAVAALPGWVERSVVGRLPPALDDARSADLMILVETAGAAAADEGRRGLEDAVRREPGIDHGPAPLQVLRSLVSHPTAVLRSLEIPEPERAPFDRQAFPDDVYDLSPATWADIDPALHEPGIAWGAATAYLHKIQRPSS